MQLLLAILSLTACASAAAQVQSNIAIGYHERVGIPLASKIKAAEDAFIASQNPMSRIVGGIVATPHTHPYMGGLLITFVNRPGTSVCGSTLITHTRLVTAGHCWFDGVAQADRFVVVVGSHMLFSGGHRVTASTVVTHPGWNPATMQNDIAVIYLQNPVLVSMNIRPMALPCNVTDTFEGEWAVAVGYGRTSDQQLGVSVLAVLNEVNLQVISVEECQEVFGPKVTASNLCTSGVDGVGICGGDTGGPLFVSREGHRVLIGIGSFVSAAGCQRGFPSGFTRITSFYDFLVAHM